MKPAKDDERGATEWTWEPADVSPEVPERLLYEPGNWGDILKGIWAATIIETLLRPSLPFSFLDPYVGAPSYPLSADAARRLQSVSSARLNDLVRRHVDGGRWPSTASLVSGVCAHHGIPVQLRVFDVDPRRRAAWRHVAADDHIDIVVEDVASGEALLSQSLLNAWLPEHPALVLVDPYDFFDHWGKWLPRIERIAARVPVLSYLYDKSARSAGHRDQYRRLRGRLEELRGQGIGVLLGRIASDAISPRAHHVVVLAAPAAVIDGLREALQAETTGLAANQGCDTEFLAFES